MNRPKFTLRAVIAVTAVVAVVFWSWTYTSRLLDDAMYNREARSELYQIGLALTAYHAAWNVYPPTTTYDAEGRPYASWRTLLLPYLSTAPPFDKKQPSYDATAGWDAPINQAAGAASPRHYCGRKASSSSTRYLAVVGEHTVLGESGSLRQNQIVNSSALMVVQVEPSDIPWTQPGDISVDELLDRFQQQKLGSAGLEFLCADGSPHFVNYGLPVEKLRRLLTADEPYQ